MNINDNVLSLNEIIEYKRKADLYEKLRRLSPREYTALYGKHVTGDESFDDLVARWKSGQYN